MQNFNPLTIPLEGQQLIEASAGTGKTYSIALLYLRLIVEEGLDVDSILVVTFTKSATEELRQRIRSRLREALDCLENAETVKIEHDDVLLAEFLGTLEDKQKAVQRLTDSLTRMDESAVFTIHSFCQRMLQDHTFESGSSFDTEFIESEKDLRREIIRDFWRQRFYQAPETETAWATKNWGDPDKLATLLDSLLTQPGVMCIPEVTDEVIAQHRLETENLLQTVRNSWQQSEEQISDILRNDPCLSRNKTSGYSQERIDKALAGIEQLVTSGSMAWQLPQEMNILASSVMAGKLIGKKILPDHEFFRLFDEYFQSHQDTSRLARIHVLFCAYTFLTKELTVRKDELDLLYFNDLLIRVDKAISNPEGRQFVQRIQDRFAVALVDEFQDTDPLQYRIFHALFGQRSNPGLFMIGDPKQSIYSFRGADVFAYIKAKKDTLASASFTMDTNFRSTSDMVGAMNRLFDKEDSFIFKDDISFAKVAAGGNADDTPLVIDGTKPEPLQVKILPVDEFANPKKKTIAIGRAAKAASRWAAQEIFRLLQMGFRGEATVGDRPLSGGDIAILVRTHREAELVRQDLSRFRIASVYYSQDSVYSTDEALELQLVLTALLDLSKVTAVTTALATGLFGMDGHTVDQLQTEAGKWDELIAMLEAYYISWRRKGIAPMLQKLMAEQQVVQRVIEQPRGERKLTNYLHLAELLQEASEKHTGMDSLVRWLSTQRKEPEETNTSQQLRLESDENLVRIVTVHKAKGLEYPLVFLPFVWSARTVDNNEIISFHQPDTLEKVIDIGSGEHAHYLLAERERLAEDLRLLYVAFTRARYCCYFSWGRINSLEKTALAWLLHRGKSEQEPALADLTEERIVQDLSSLNDHENLLGFRPPFPEELLDEPTPSETDSALSEKKFTGNIDTSWVINSYSRMVSSEVHVSSQGEVEYAQHLELPEVLERNAFTFPKGATAGTCLHNILEQLEFSNYSAVVLQQITEEQLRKTGLDISWTPIVCKWVEDVLGMHMDSTSGLKLQLLKENALLKEMGFYFAMQKFSLSRLNNILSAADFTPIKAESEDVTGLMRGYIDLVFCFQGRYFIADYKSNYLGPGAEYYTKTSLKAAMEEHRYDLQYLIYTVALHRYLRTRITGYNYRKHFGGVYYLFIRGMRPDYSPGNGIYFTQPPLDLIQKLDACFGHLEAT